jgi:hypothetical protein
VLTAFFGDGKMECSTMSDGATAASVATSNALRVVVKTLIDGGALDLEALRANLMEGRDICPSQNILELYDTLCVFILPDQRVAM